MDIVERAKMELGDGFIAYKTMKSEKDVKENVKRFLAQWNALWKFMPVQSGFGVAGTPDFIGCIRGRMFGIETKFGGNKSTPLQLRTQKSMREAGAHVYEVDEKNFQAFTIQFTQWVIGNPV